MIWNLHHLSTNKVLKPTITRTFASRQIFTIPLSYDPLVAVCAESRRIVHKNSEAMTNFEVGGPELMSNTMRYRPDTDIIFLSWDEIAGEGTKHDVDVCTHQIWYGCYMVLGVLATSSFIYSYHSLRRHFITFITPVQVSSVH